MRNIYLSIVVLFVATCFLPLPVLAVNTARIDVVRSKELLVEADTAAIEDFLSAALEELFLKNDFSDVGALRTTIISRSFSELESGQIQYGPRFMTVAQTQISQCLKKVSDLPDSERKQLLTMNLMILIDNLGNIEIAKSALDYIQNPDVMVRYWAVSSLTNKSILSQLNMTESAANGRLAEQITEKLQTMVQTESSGDILTLLARFAAELKKPAANEILNKIVEKRTKLYLNWEVKNEMFESWILSSLAERVRTDPENAKITMRNFATLYSLVVQRYALGSETLSEQNIQNLTSIIIQTEKDIIPRFVTEWSGSLKRAIEKGGGAAILAEHDVLFGSAGAAGKLPVEAGFDYGKNPDGSVKIFPPQLQRQPKK